MQKISFTINYQVQEKRKFEKFIKNYEIEIGYPFHELNIDRYWKIPEQFQATFCIEINQNTNSEIVYKILLLINQLCKSASGNLSFNGPYAYENELSFRCYFNSNQLNQPLKWVEIGLV